jgi:hypothetical protein
MSLCLDFGELLRLRDPPLMFEGLSERFSDVLFDCLLAYLLDYNKSYIVA